MKKNIPFELIDNKKAMFKKKDLEIREKVEPKIKSNNISCPGHLSKEAKKEWRKIIKLYKEMELPILNNLDRNALEVYCETLVSYRNALVEIRNSKEIITTITGRVMKNPWCEIADKAATTLKQYGSMLLLDPISRAKIGTVSAAAKKLELENDPMEKLLNESIRR